MNQQTQTEQMRNVRSNHLITHDGKTRCISEWVEITGIPKDTLRLRLGNSKWSVEKAMTTPVRKLRRLLTFCNETHPISVWSKIIGVNRDTLQRRLDKQGWSLKRALLTPSRNASFKKHQGHVNGIKPSHNLRRDMAAGAPAFAFAEL